ncbi:MAG: O-acetyl-ADP-ribose deacetylase [Marinilabiliaceae bacterium]|nr:O-acetyl-ADP-ribose deacetylase [Marinilabiliaceae bacterium]
MTDKIQLLHGDITKIKADAIVNAANSSLLGGGGVDGAIHKAAGYQLLNECKLLKGCKTGEAKLTNGYMLPAKYVIHTVGPIWSGGYNNEANLLQSCYLSALTIALDNKFGKIAFPNISTGVYGYPKKEAASIAINTTIDFIKKHEYPKQIIFALFDNENLALYNEILVKYNCDFLKNY